VTFEPMQTQPVVLHLAQNEIGLHAWGNRNCWLPRGATVRRLLEEYILGEERQAGYQHVYTPQIASIGLSEAEARDAGHTVSTGVFPFRGNARAVVWGETGGFTKELVIWAAERTAQVVTIEPYPTPEINRLAEDSSNFELINGRSPAALRELAPADAYVVDGDHNHWTVSRELEAIFDGAGGTPIAILHDVGWPCARRDQYYAPDALPTDAVLPHSFTTGRTPGTSALVEGGCRRSGQFAVAIDAAEFIRATSRDAVETAARADRRRDLRRDRHPADPRSAQSSLRPPRGARPRHRRAPRRKSRPTARPNG